MILTIDIGNSNTVIGFFAEDKLISTSRFITAGNITVDELIIKFAGILNYNKIGNSAIKQIIIANVVPSLNDTYHKLAADYFNLEALFVRNFLANFPLNITLPNMAEIGEDRLANSLAAQQIYAANLIVVDFGTAITFDIVLLDKGYVGGIIYPGINLAINYLTSATAQLPQVALKPTAKIVGESTKEAIESGIFNGYLATIEGLITKIKQAYILDFKVIATGGMGGLFCEHSDLITDFDTNLTLKGLNFLHKHI